MCQPGELKAHLNAHPFSAAYVTLTPNQLYAKHETEKEKFYGERVRQVEKGSLIFWCYPSQVEWGHLPRNS